MKLIVGLGNPGRSYAFTRHNAGFMVVEALADLYQVKFKKETASFSFTAQASAAEVALLLALPQTYMNLSGTAVRALMRTHHIALRDLLVVCDDMDLAFGRIKVRSEGSSGGHNGLESITQGLGTREFARLRIGIDRPPSGLDPADYVLMPFLTEERKILKEIMEKAVSCCESWVVQGICKSMNVFNKK